MNTRRIIDIPQTPLYETLELVGKKCPFCGELKQASIIFQTKGVTRTKKTWYTFKWFKCGVKRHSVEIFSCSTCGANWEENRQTTIFKIDEEEK